MDFMRRGQSAIEFLTTYGWSFMILLVAIGALSYIGVFDLSFFVPESCNFGGGIGCPIFALEKDDTSFAVNVQFSNALGDRIEVVNMAVKDADLEEYCLANDLTDVAGNPLVTSTSRTLVNNQEREFVFEFDDGVSNCDFEDSLVDTTRKRNYDVRLYYIPDGASQQVSLEGTIIARTQEYTP